MMIMNSPVKPLVPGTPTLANVTMSHSAAYTGITLARPPNSSTMRVWRRS
jgi:hypothetical protein